MGSGARWRLGHVPALDGLRAVAVLLVMACHFDRGQFTAGGTIGVTTFFTLSGFLITTRLLEEHDSRDSISLLGFYRSRALRLFPAVAVLLVVLLLLTWGGLPTRVGPGLALSAAGYVANWYLLAGATGGQVHWSALSHTWSLAIEEQFYLVWPLVCLLALRSTRRPARPGTRPPGRRLLAGISVAGSLVSLTLLLTTSLSILNTAVSAYGLLLGCAFAAWMNGRRAVRPSPWLAGVAVALLVGGIGLHHEDLCVALTPPITVLLLWVVVQVEVGWLGCRPLVWVGRRSYGLYLWHVPVAWLAADVTGVPYAAATAGGVLVSFLCCALSWTFVEAPFLRLKDTLTGRRQPQTHRPPPEPVSSVQLRGAS